MTTYWKSQDRKYCQFCKCWFADNKVSISFHENGKRHKESVKKHISQLSKRSAKEFKHKEKMEDDIKKMEAAAMTAYLKDVQNNADITSQNINEMLGQSGNSSKDIIISNDNIINKPPWHEMKSENGNSYYWNKQTNETVLEAPESYLTIEQQEENKTSEKEEQKKQKKLKKQREKEAKMEAKAYTARESMRELAVEKEKPASSVDYGPAPYSSPLGAWKPVVKETVEKIDFQLPKCKEAPPPPVVLVSERLQFKEKRVESLGEGPVEFKKRKFANSKRNMRQKCDDE